MNATECPPGYSNSDELALRQSSDCHISDDNVQAVQWFNIVSLSLLAIMAFVKAYPLVAKGQFKWDYIPHAVILCWGTFGVLTGSLFLYKAMTSLKVSEVHTTELIFHSFAPVPFFPAVWMFVFSLMAVACSSEIGARASLLRKRFWLLARFFMVTEMILYPLPFWFTIAFPSWVHATSVCMVLNLISIALPIGVSTGVFVRMIDGVLAGVVDQEKGKLAAKAKRTALISPRPNPLLPPVASKGSTTFEPLSSTLSYATGKVQTAGGGGGGGEGVADRSRRFGRQLSVKLNLRSSRYSVQTKASSALLRQLEGNRRRMRIAAYVVCFGTTLPGAIMLALSLSVEYMGRNSFVTYSACYGLAAIVGMGAVFVVKASPPNKHTHPSMFLSGAGVLGDGLRSRVDKVFQVMHHYSTEGGLRFSSSPPGQAGGARRPVSYPLRSVSRGQAGGRRADSKRVEILTTLPAPERAEQATQQQNPAHDGAPATAAAAPSRVRLPQFHVRPYHSRSAPETSCGGITTIQVSSVVCDSMTTSMEDVGSVKEMPPILSEVKLDGEVHGEEGVGGGAVGDELV